MKKIEILRMIGDLKFRVDSLESGRGAVRSEVCPDGETNNCVECKYHHIGCCRCPVPEWAHDLPGFIKNGHRATFCVYFRRRR